MEELGQGSGAWGSGHSGSAAAAVQQWQCGSGHSGSAAEGCVGLNLYEAQDITDGSY